MKETFQMSRKELERLRMLHQVETKAITLRYASEEMGVSERQAKRIWARYRRDGEAGLVHASRGRLSNRRLATEQRRIILDLYRTHYRDYGPTLASEVLESEHGVKVHEETLRRILHSEHLLAPRCGPQAHRSRRPRRNNLGSLLQVDGSDHDWFEDRGPRSCLMVAVDDATGRCLALMSEEETTRAAFALLRLWIERYGVPEALYVDRRNVYVVDREPHEEEKRQGSGALTDFGRGCWRLGIRIIKAHSPQAKGRVERKNAVFQDRLVKELRRRGISDIGGANAMLEEFTAGLDAKFAVDPASPLDRHRAKPSGRELDSILCWEEKRKVGRDWTVSWKGGVYQILRQPGLPKAGDQVKVRRLMDGSVNIIYENRELKIIAETFPNINHAVSPPPMGGGLTGSPRSVPPP